MLKPHGFKKRGRTFRRINHGNSELVEFQRSLTNGPHDLRFTLNIGIVSHCLAKQNGADASKAGSADAHLRRRIGTFLPEPHDKWWELNAEIEADHAAKEIKTVLIEKIIPYLDAHSSDTALIQLWKGGQAPGLTDTLRLRYLTALEAAAVNEFTT